MLFEEIVDADEFGIVGEAGLGRGFQAQNG